MEQPFLMVNEIVNFAIFGFIIKIKKAILIFLE